MRSVKKVMSFLLVCLMLVSCIPAGVVFVGAEYTANRDTKTILDIKNADGSPVRIACIGDSITYGTMISNVAENSYPAKLGKLLGEGYDVQNFGRPSSYLLSEDSPYNVRAGKNLCYTDLPQYTSSIDFAPNVVIIMLGTNDMMSMVDQASCNAVKDALVSLVRSYQALSSVKRVYVMTSIFSQIEYTYYLTSDGGLQSVQKKAAEESGAEFADIYSLTKGYFDVMLHKVDRLHPNNASSNAIPRAVHSILTGCDYFPPEAPTASGNVVYVSDSGSMTNDGATADTPINNIAYAGGLLRKTGGTIVVCGEQTIANNGTFMPEADVKIKITSVYGGVDYRSTNGARLVVHTGNFYIGTPTEFDNITIHSSNSSKFVCGYNDVTFGKNVSCTVASGVSYPSIIAGHNIANGAPTKEQVSFDGECNVTVNGGTWYYIRCGNLRASANSTIGTVNGSVVATVNGGSFKCTSLSAARDMEILNGTTRLVINGGSHAGGLALGRASSGTGYSYIEINGGSFTSKIICPETVTGRSKVLLNTADISVSIQGNGTNSKAYIKEGLADTLKNKFASFGTVGSYAPVVFVRDGGTGNGLSAASPLGDINTAYSKLAGNGGTIVICGQYTMTGTVTEPGHDAPVTLTQKYNGTDYRSVGKLSTGGAIRKYELNGVFKLENISIEGGSNAGLFMIAQYNLLTVGEGVKTYGFSGEMMSDSLNLIGGFNSSTTPLRHGSGDSQIVVHSGNGMTIAGMNRYMTNTHQRSSRIEIYGGEIGRIYGGNVSGGTGAGAYVNVYGGKLLGAIDLSSGTAGESVLFAEYGDFSQCPSISGGDGISRAILYNRNYEQTASILSDFDTVDKVAPTVFVKQGGTGSGSDAKNPTGTITSAYIKLGDNGGRIVICGAYTLTGSFTEPVHSGPVTLTQMHGGNDHSDGGAFSTGGSARAYNLSGKTIFENMSFSTSNNAGLLIVARYNPVEIGYGVVCSGFDGNSVATSFSVIGGYNNAIPASGAGTGDSDITVRSGVGVLIVGLDRYIADDTDRSSHISVYGGDIGKIYAGSVNGGAGKNTNVELFGGRFFNTVDCAYRSTGTVKLLIKDADLSSCHGIVGAQGRSEALVYGRVSDAAGSLLSGFTTVTVKRDTVYLKQGASGDGSTDKTPVGTLGEAYSKVAADGGTIVVMGDFIMNGSYTEPVHSSRITVTSHYNGTDYSAGGSFSTGGAVRGYYLSGDTVFENISFSTSDSAGLLIIGRYNSVELGEGVECSGFDGNSVSTSLTLIGGYNGGVPTSGLGDGDASITVRSGEGILIVGMNRFVDETFDKNTNIRVYGGSIGKIYGGCVNGGEGGNAEVLLDGGSYGSALDLGYGVGGSVRLTAKNGSFASCPSVTGKQGNATAVVYARLERTLVPIMCEFDNVDIYSAVVYLKQGATGNGTSADDPIGTITSAYTMLGDNGGTIVVMGSFKMQSNFTAPVTSGTVKITGVYNGIDHRSGGAFSTGGTARRFDINGPTVFENISISTSNGAGLLIVGNYNPLEIGEGVACSGFAGDAVSNSLALIGGENGTAAPLKETGEDAHVTVRSGSGILIAGLDRYITANHEKNAVIDIYGGEVVTVYGGNINGGKGSSSEINIYGGEFKGLIDCAYGISDAVRLNVYSGDLTECESIRGSYELDCSAFIAESVRSDVMDIIYGFIDLVEKGDIDLDMTLTNSDISLLVRYLAGFDGIREELADVNGDGRINNRDAIELIRRIA